MGSHDGAPRSYPAAKIIPVKWVIITASWYNRAPTFEGTEMEKINGKKLAVETQGDGDAVIMVHGLGGTSNTYWPQVATLAKTFTVIRPDLEGSGRSPVKGKLSIAGFVSDLLALMKARDIKSAHFVGHSMGTVVCQHIAAKNPTQVKSLALLGPLAAPPTPARQALKDRAAAARANGMAPIADAMVGVSISASTRAHRPEVAAMVREILMRQDAEVRTAVTN